MSKFGDNIRIIAGYEKLKKLIKEAQDTADQAKKLSIENRKHIAYLDNKTLTTSSSTGTTGTSKPTGGTNNNSTAANQIGTADGNIFNAGTGTSLENSSGQSNATTPENPLNGASTLGTSDNVGGSDNSSKEGSYSAGSLLTGNSDANSGGKSPPVASGNTDQPFQSQNNQYTGQKIVRITGAKTDDGTRDVVIAVGSSGAAAYIGPNDWESAFEGPVDTSFEQGRVWAISFGSDTILTTTFSDMIASREAVEGAKAYGVAGGLITSIPPTSGGDIQFSTDLTGVVGGSSGALGGTVYSYQVYSPGVTIAAVGAYGMEDCDLRSTLCDVAIPRQTQWSDLGVTQLGWISGAINDVLGFPKEYIGRFMPHPYDVNVPSEFTNGASILDLKTTDDDTPFRIGALKEGGWYMYERNPAADNAPAGSPTENTVLIIRSNGTVSGYITPNQLTTMLP